MLKNQTLDFDEYMSFLQFLMYIMFYYAYLGEKFLFIHFCVNDVAFIIPSYLIREI